MSPSFGIRCIRSDREVIISSLNQVYKPTNRTQKPRYNKHQHEDCLPCPPRLLYCGMDYRPPHGRSCTHDALCPTRLVGSCRCRTGSLQEVRSHLPRSPCGLGSCGRHGLLRQQVRRMKREKHRQQQTRRRPPSTATTVNAEANPTLTVGFAAHVPIRRTTLGQMMVFTPSVRSDLVVALGILVSNASIKMYVRFSLFVLVVWSYLFVIR